MAKKNSSGSGEPRGNDSTKRDGMVKKADILTASKGAMEPCDYSKGYPPNNSEMLANKSGRKPGKGI